MNRGWIYYDRVNHATAGLTLLMFYAQRYRHSTLQTWQDRILAGQIWVDGQPAPAETQLSRGQQLAYHRPPWQEPEVPLTFEVHYDDGEVVVVAKPAGLPVLPGGGFLEHTLWWQVQQRFSLNTPMPVHRLGRGTSGLVLMARSPQARAELSRQLRDHQIGKTYRALVGKVEGADHFSIDHPIGKVSHPVLGYIYAATPQGRWAHSDCQVLDRQRDATILEVTILTGRPHQIRIHLAVAGYPLIGDPLYGVGGLPHPLPEATQTHSLELPVPGDCGYHLHAYALAFSSPRSGEPLEIVCPPPPILAVSTMG